MRQLLILLAAVAGALVLGDQASAASSSSVAALQVALRAQGHYPATVDGVDGPLTRSGLAAFQQKTGLPPDSRMGAATRTALGSLGRPLLGQRELGLGAVGWDVSSLEFRLVPFGLRIAAVDGRFTTETAKVLALFQTKRGLPADGIAGTRTFRALAGGSTASFSPPIRAVHVVQAGESFFSIGQSYGVSPLLLAKESGLELLAVIVPGQRLKLPAGIAAKLSTGAFESAPVASRDAVRASIDRWSAAYGVDPRLARATAWMESGFQESVVSNVGAVGVMQLLPETWAWVDVVLLGTTTPRTYDGNVRAGVRYLRWLLDEFAGDRRLALAGYYQGARAVRQRGLFDDTKQYVAVILKLYGSV